MKIVYYALSAFAALVVVVICLYIACVTINNKKVSNTPSKTEVVNLDKTYRVSNAKFKGHDYLLFEILKTSFVQRKYDQAIKDLNKLVGTNISESTRNRAYFYIGEAQYLTGDYNAAVKTFIKIQQVYPIQTKKWLDSALNKL